MPRLLPNHKRKNVCEECDGEPAKKISRLEEPHNRKGFMLILNHEFFNDKTLIRPGTNVDQENLVKTFSKFNFEIETLKDLNYKQITELAEECKYISSLFELLFGKRLMVLQFPTETLSIFPAW